jgi:hypothetical protein
LVSQNTNATSITIATVLIAAIFHIGMELSCSGAGAGTVGTFTGDGTGDFTPGPGVAPRVMPGYVAITPDAEELIFYIYKYKKCKI